MSNNKYRALIVAYNGLGNSGVPNLILQVVKSLYDKYDFDVLVFDDSDYYYGELKKYGGRVIKYNDVRAKTKIGRITNYLFKRDKKYYEFCKALILENNYTSLHSFKESDSAPFFKAAKDCNVEKIIYHCTVIQDGPKNPVKRALFKKKMRKSLELSNIRIGVSQKCCDIAFNKYTSYVLHNSYNESLYKYSDEHIESGIKLLHLSSFSNNKNQLFSADVLKHLTKLDANASLVFIGDSGDSTYKKKVIDFINKNDLKNNVSFLTSDKIEEIIKNITFYILPSKKEGASIVTIESQALGFKIFASNTLSPDMDVGGCVFLDLKKGPSFWAKTIFEYYLKNGCKRIQYDMESFSSRHFKKDLRKIYGIE